MAHGFGGSIHHGLEPFAVAFAEAGFVVLLHDHRGFGRSGGDKSLIKDGVYQTALANPILRSGRGGDYVEVTQDRVFEMERPPGSSHPAFHGS
nr:MULTISPECIES: lysophospholipase [unclassified Bradyrhizobium]